MRQWSIPLLVAGTLMVIPAAGSLTGCTSGEKSLAEVDPEAAALTPDYREVQAILERNCVPCHTDDKPAMVEPLAADYLALATPSGLDRDTARPVSSMSSQNDDDDEDDDREFEEDDPEFDTCEGIQAGFGVLLRVIAEDTMPPGAWPRLTEREKLVLLNWFVNGACSPCTEPCP